MNTKLLIESIIEDLVNDASLSKIIAEKSVEYVLDKALQNFN
jgi:hypothetical protein